MNRQRGMDVTVSFYFINHSMASCIAANGQSRGGHGKCSQVLLRTFFGALNKHFEFLVLVVFVSWDFVKTRHLEFFPAADNLVTLEHLCLKKIVTFCFVH